jgi:hypothetical protein
MRRQAASKRGVGKATRRKGGMRALLAPVKGEA